MGNTRDLEDEELILFMATLKGIMMGIEAIRPLCIFTFLEELHANASKDAASRSLIKEEDNGEDAEIFDFEKFRNGGGDNL